MHRRECSIAGLPAGTGPFPDDYLLDIITVNADSMYSHPKYLEPLYDGHEPASWSECAWQPNRVTG
jgi:hypothetical protein